MTVRLFVAAWPGEELRAEIAGRQATLRETGASARWVAPENLHVTLHFLGPSDPARVEELGAWLGNALASEPAFPVRMGGLGVFPPEGPPRVVWVGFAAGAPELEALASRLEPGLVRGGFLSPPDRPFRAHVTLGRSKGPRGLERPAPSDVERIPPGRLHELAEVRLVESRSGPRGQVYVPVARFPLCGSP